MSFRVLIIPEDFRNDEHLLQPILERLVSAQAKSRPRVRVCKEPNLGGTGEALKIERIREILDRYRSMIDCFLLTVDRDGQSGRRGSICPCVEGPTGLTPAP